MNCAQVGSAAGKSVTLPRQIKQTPAPLLASCNRHHWPLHHLYHHKFQTTLRELVA